MFEEILLPNSPPRIKEETAKPEVQPVPLPNPDCKVEFSAWVEDPDVDDLVTFRWYIDYNPESRTIPEDEQYFQNTGKPERKDAARLSILNTPQHAQLGAAGHHEVTLMVFDGNLLLGQGPGTQPEPDPVPGVEGGDKRYSTTHSWTVITDPSQTCTELVSP